MLSPVTLARDLRRTGRSPRAWLVRSLCVTAAVALSLGLHGSLPLLGRLIADARAVSTLELLAYAPPVMLPVDVVDRDGPAADPEPEGPEADSAKEAPSGSESAPVEDVETLIDDQALVAPEPPPAPAEVERALTPVDVAHAEPPKERPEPRRDSRAERLKRRQQALARLVKLRAAHAEELARRGKGKGKGGATKKGEGGRGGGEGGGTARAYAKKGNPDAVYACTKDGLGKKVDVRFDRPVSDWVTVVPTVLMPFEARPSLGEYLDGVSQVVSRRRGGVTRAGPVEFALPATVLQMNVDEPRGVRVALGHLDGRCLVGLKYTRELFPLTLSRVPMRVVDHANRSASALVNVTLYKDASFSLEVLEGEVPFDEGRLANAKRISDTIEQHYAAARAFKEIAGWFGVDVAKMAREARVERAKERSAQKKSAQKKQRPKKGGKVVRRR